MKSHARLPTTTMGSKVTEGYTNPVTDPSMVIHYV